MGRTTKVIDGASTTPRTSTQPQAVLKQRPIGTTMQPHTPTTPLEQ